MARAEMLAKWLPQPRLRNRHAYCANDPVNRFDPNGHWSVGGVLLSVLGVLWTLPNTAFGLAIEVSCLLGEVVRWLVWAVTAGNVSWQTPGFDVASSGRLNAFALVFKGGWLGFVREPARHHVRQRDLRQRQVPGAPGVAGAARSGDAAGL